MNTTVSHKLLFHLVASKEAVFIKVAFGSLDVSKITLHKPDLNFLYQAGSCFAALFIYEGKRLAKKQLQADWSVNPTSATCYC